MNARGQMRIGALVAALVCAAPGLDAAQGDVVAKARGLATAGQRAEAIALLRESVGVTPGNSDARVLLGTVLSWEGRFDEARVELDLVLAGSPTHGDALPASINVELWSGHPGRAEELSRRGLRQRPGDAGYLLGRARALVAMKRPTEARDAVERLLAIDPRSAPGQALKKDLQASLRLWQARADVSHDTFSDRASWRESHMSLGRATPVGSILVRGSRARRFGLTDNQVEVEMYPRLRPGTYAYVAGAYAPEALLYPRYRYAADLYQSLGAGFEGSAGFRRLGFGSGVNIYTGSLSKYYGNWLFTGRVFLTPNDAGPSRSVHASFRRYLGDGGTYVGMRYGRGAWREEPRNLDDLEVLDSDTAAADATIVLRGRLVLNLSGAYSREDRADRAALRGYSLSTGFGVRF
jgi:YaiO family outer membrane protein